MIPHYFLCVMQSSHIAVELDRDIGLRAGQIGACVEVKWNKVQAGACHVRYEVILRNSSSGVISSETGYNIGEMMMCDLRSNRYITFVDLTVSFKAASNNFTANVTEPPVSSPAPVTQGMTPVCSYSLG